MMRGNTGRVARTIVCAVVCSVASVSSVGTLGAQQTINLEQAINQARLMVEGGNGRAGRLMLDSLVQQASVGTPALGELLYWRGLLSEASIDAERDWRRLLLEVPMSPRAEDALLRLAQLELLRGKPAASRALLEQMIGGYADRSSQARAHYWLARTWFDENDRARGCGALTVVQANAPDNAVELRTQSDALRAQCRGVTAIAPTVVAPAVAAAVTLPPRVAAARDSVVTVAPVRVVDTPPTRAVQIPITAAPPAAQPPVSAPPTAAARTAAASGGSTTRPANARFSVQLAAYTRLDQAQALVRTLAQRNVDARVDGTSNPFRVRTGYYATRAQAAARLAELKKQGHDGFVAELTP